MPERISTDQINESPLRFAIAALCRTRTHPPHVGRGFIEIEFKVDGVAVPFAATIKDIYARMNEQVNKRAAELAYETGRLQGLEQLNEAVARADGEIRAAIEHVFGVTLDD